MTMPTTSAASDEVLPILTGLPTGNGEAFLHLERTSISRIKRSLPHSLEGQIKKWQQVIRAAAQAKKSCKVRMIMGFEADDWNKTVLVDDMTIRVL